MRGASSQFLATLASSRCRNLLPGGETTDNNNALPILLAFFP